MGSRLKRLRLAAAHSLTLARLRAEFAIDRQENMRFCRAEMPSYCVKALENTQSILCGLFLVCEHFSSGRTASHRTALDFRGIFVLLDAGGLSPAKDKRAKSTEKTYLSDVCALVNRRFQMMKRPADRSDNTVLSAGLVISCKPGGRPAEYC